MYSINEANRDLNILVSTKSLPTPTKITKKLILYGVGNMGKLAKFVFYNLGFDVDLIRGKNPNKSSDIFEKLNIDTL